MPCFSGSKAKGIAYGAFQQQQPSAKQPAYPLTRDRCASVTSIASQRKEEPSKPKGYGAFELNSQQRRTKQSKSRHLAVPSNKALLPQKEFKRLKVAAKVVSVEERLDALMKQQQQNARLEEEAERTREHFKKMDDERKRAAEEHVESSDDVFGVGEKLMVLERSFLAKTEQEEEVKQANSIILNAKCHAIRDAQIQEKAELERQQRSDTIRLEKQVIESAVKALNEEDKKVEKENETKQQYAKEIKKQLDERENLRYLESKRLEQEANMLKRATEALKRDDERQAQLQLERKNKLRDELARIAEMSTMFKKMICEQEREMDLRTAAYLREKEQRDRALQAEKKLAKEELQRKQHRIFMLAQKVLESKSKREETAYLREQEKMERDYRTKEKEAALRKQQIEKEIRDARLQQKEDAKHRQALQIARAEQDFNVLVEQVKQDEAKQQKLDEAISRRRLCYRADIIRQMSDKELERRRLLELESNRAMAWRESERQRNENILAVIHAKMNAMRDACLPEKYIKDVEKQMQKIALTRNTKK